MTQISNHRSRHSESGIALLIAMFTLLLITAIGVGMILLTNTEKSTSANFRDEQTAFFSAKAGIEEVRDRLRSTASNTLNGSLPTALLGHTGGVLYVLNPTNGETDTPWITNGTAYPDDEVCSEVANMGAACAGSPPVPAGSPWYSTTTASASYAANPVMAWKWARVNVKTNKTSSGTSSVSTVDGVTTDNNELVCWTGTNEISTTQATCGAAGPSYQPVYVVTALAVTPSGSRRMVQAEVTPNVTIFPTLPGAMIFDGSSPTFSAPNSAAFTVTGIDQSTNSTTTNPDIPQNGAACPAPQNQPALGGYDAASVTALSGDASKRPSSYTGATGTGSPSVSNVSSALGALDTVGGLEALVTQVTSMANPANVVNGNASGITNPGTTAAPVVNVVTGNLTLAGGFTGAGILLVEGTLTMSGNPSYDGIILVIGQGSLTKNGGGNGTLDGSLLVANLYNSSGQLLPSTSAPGAPTINWNGGGTATIQYDSCWSTAMSTSAVNYRAVAMREMMY